MIIEFFQSGHRRHAREAEQAEITRALHAETCRTRELTSDLDDRLRDLPGGAEARMMDYFARLRPQVHRTKGQEH